MADDQVVLFASGGRLYGRAPDPLAGLIEIRGQGVHRADALPFARITLTARLAPDPKTVDRWPDPESVSWLSVATPVLQVWPFEPAATVKLCSAMEFLGCSAE